VIPAPLIPVVYAAALSSGSVNDRTGLRGLVILPGLAAVITSSPSRLGRRSSQSARVWGAVMGIH
jgi:hypothetical protein